MVNARIVDSILTAVATEQDGKQVNELVLKFTFSYLEDNEEKIVSTPTIRGITTQDIVSFLVVTEAQNWETVIGKVVRLEVDGDNVLSITNIVDENAKIEIMKPENNGGQPAEQ